MPEGGLPAGAENMMNLMPILGGIMQPIIYLIMTALTAFLLWALCRLVGAKPTFRQMMIVSTYSSACTARSPDGLRSCSMARRDSTPSST